MVFIWGYRSRGTARMGWQLGCESSFPNYNSQKASDAHSPRDVTAAEGEGRLARRACRLLVTLGPGPWLGFRGKWSNSRRLCPWRFCSVCQQPPPLYKLDWGLPSTIWSREGAGNPGRNK